MVVMGIGAVLGLVALAGIVWALKKLEPPKKWAALVAFLIVGAGGGFLVMNATAFTQEEAEPEDFDPEDFDAPLEDDWGEEWPEEGEGAAEGAAGDEEWADDDWADEVEEAAEGEPAAE
jgi:hypothetical protein